MGNSGKRKTMSESTKNKKEKNTEEFSVSGEDLINKVKEILKKGQAKKIAIRNKDGQEIMSFPVTVGVAGALLAPIFSALGTITALAAKCTIVVTKKEA